jgi:hypothetical protein
LFEVCKDDVQVGQMLVSSWQGGVVAGTSSTSLCTIGLPRFRAADSSARMSATYEKNYLGNDSFLDFMEFGFCSVIFWVPSM